MAKDQDLEALAGVPPKGRMGAIVGITAVIIGVIIATAVLLDRRAQARFTRDIEARWSKASTCLLGDPPTAADAPARMRAIQIATAEQPAKGDDAWPTRCAPLLDDTAKVLGDAGRAATDHDDFARTLQALANTLRGHSQLLAVTDYSVEIKNAYAAAEKEGYHATLAADVVAAPKPVAPLFSLGDLKKGKPLTKKPLPLSSIKGEMHIHQDIAFLVDDKLIDGSPFVCLADDEAPRVSCTKLAKAVVDAGGIPTLSASRAAGAKPLVVLGDHGRRGVYQLDGRPVFTGEKFGWASVDRDGKTTALTYRDEYEHDKKSMLKLWRSPDPKDAILITPPYAISEDNVYYAAFLGNGYVAWHGRNSDPKIGDSKIEIFVQRILAGDPPLSPVVSAGEVGYRNDSERTWFTCESATRSFLAFSGEGSSWLTSRPLGDPASAWSPPAQLGLFGAVACHGDDFTTTSGSDDGVHTMICRAGSCQTFRAELPGGSERSAADLSGTIATVARIRDRGGIHLRVAPIDALAKATGTLLFDDLSTNGMMVESPWLTDTDLLTMGKKALLFVSTSEGVYLLRVSSDGKVELLDVVFE